MMAGVEVSPVVRQKLYPAFHDAFRCGRGGAEEAALQAHLPGSGWQWPEFERWAATFARQQQWPPAWQKYPALAGPLRPPPRQVSEALPYFCYLELRDILNVRVFGRQPAPLRVEELSQAFVERLSWEEIAPLAADFAARFHAGDVTLLPPFFPGDQSRLQLVRA